MSSETFLNRSQLAERWRCSVKKIDNDRLNGRGCRHVKIGRLVRYRLSDIVDYEDVRVRRSTSDTASDLNTATGTSEGRRT